MIENITPHSAKYYELPLWPTSTKSASLSIQKDHISQKTPAAVEQGQPWDSPRLVPATTTPEGLVEALTPFEENIFLAIEGRLLECSRKIVSLYGDSLRQQGELDLESYIKAQLFKAFVHDPELLKEERKENLLQLQAPESLEDVGTLYEGVIQQLKQDSSFFSLALTALLSPLQMTLLSQKTHPLDYSKPLFLSILRRLPPPAQGDILG